MCSLSRTVAIRRAVMLKRNAVGLGAVSAIEVKPSAQPEAVPTFIKRRAFWEVPR